MQEVWVITGPTATGKTSLLHHIPSDAPIEIISVDSRQIYKDIPIASCMPEKKLQNKFPHHLISFLEFQENFSAYDFVEYCKKLISEIHNKNKIPVMIGGTFFYLKSLLDGLGDTKFFPKKQISSLLLDKINNANTNVLQRYLKKLDPISSKTIHENDRYRLTKAIIKSVQYSVPYSKLKKKGGIFSKYQFYIYYISMEREKLYDKINKRTKKMLEQGMITEFIKLIDKTKGFEYPIFNTIGIKQLKDVVIQNFCLDNRKKIDFSKESIIEEVKFLLQQKNVVENIFLQISQKTRNFAKRQMTWLKNDIRINSLDYKNIVLLMVSKFKSTSEIKKNEKSK